VTTRGKHVRRTLICEIRSRKQKGARGEGATGRERRRTVRRKLVPRAAKINTLSCANKTGFGAERRESWLACGDYTRIAVQRLRTARCVATSATGATCNATTTISPGVTGMHARTHSRSFARSLRPTDRPRWLGQ